MPLGHGALEIGEAPQIEPQKFCESATIAQVLRQIRLNRPSDFLSLPISRTVPWRGEMPYGLLNDAPRHCRTARPLIGGRHDGAGL